jgi:hypothetical protein
MNKEELQIGDLVISTTAVPVPYYLRNVGLVIDDEASRKPSLRYRVYWFKTGLTFRYPSKRLTKLSPTQEEQNE